MSERRLSNGPRPREGPGQPLPQLRLALVVQRYGEAVNGGAEYHCRLVAEHLARRHHVEVITSCAKDYITWRNELPTTLDRVNGVPVRRFKVRRPRDPERFGKLSRKVFHRSHTRKDEIAWLEEQGPYSPALVRYLRRSRGRYDYFIFFSYRYYHSYHGVRELADRAILVPTAERDDVVRLGIFRELFRLPRAIVYNSIEEREMIWDASDNRAVKGDVVGVGSEVPENLDGSDFRLRKRIGDPYAIFIGRVDENKGCRQLFHFFRRYREETRSRLQLILVGGRTIPIPKEPFIRYLGFLNDEEKWEALAGADLLIMPSELESLSMVTLEAWAAGKPVLANGRCDVLRGQCRRSAAGLYYTDYYEFRETLALLEGDGRLREGLGANGRRFYLQNYGWDVIESKYDRLLAEVLAEDRTSRASQAPASKERVVAQRGPAGLLARWFHRAG